MVVKSKLFYGWIIVGIVFLIMFVSYAVRDAFPLFYVPILDEFGRSRAETALITSISFLVYGFSSAISGAFLDRFGPKKTFTLGAIIMGIGLIGCSQARELWQIFIFWGVVFSLGMSAVGWVPCNALVSNWFTKKRATAVGIAQAGGRESFLLAPVTQSLILSLGWRNTYLVQAAIAVILIILFAQFLKPSPKNVVLSPNNGDEYKGMRGSKGSRGDRLIINQEWAAIDWTLIRAIRTSRFWFLLVASFSNATGFGIVMAHQVAFVVDLGFTAMFASFLLLIFGILSLVGRLSAFISDIVGREISYTIACTGITIGFLMLVLAKDPSSSWMLYVFAVFYGLFSGLTGPTMVASEADIFLGQHLGAIIGFINIGFGLGNAVGSWFGGYIYDTFGSYFIAFVTSMVMMALACISMWVASPRKVRVARLK
ncbi:MAG: MFS transporter [Dehalococcoidia bacterium]|nr:MAG: MFS transporter [Dehalococcoidia bacterium]